METNEIPPQSRRSGGPRTPKGKRRSRRNAIKHGLTAERVVVLGAEDPGEWKALLERFYKDWQPVGVHEEQLVGEMALAEWRLRRCRREEKATIARAIEQNTPRYVSPADLRWQKRLAKARAKRGEPPIDRFLLPTVALKDVLRYETTYRRTYQRVARELERVQRVRRNREAAARAATPAAKRSASGQSENGRDDTPP